MGFALAMRQTAIHNTCEQQVLILAYCKFAGIVDVVNAIVEAQLAPPGAGLPKHELLIGRLMFAFKRRIGGRDVFNAEFNRERERIRQLVQSCGADSLARRVLIARAIGMEDSSRNWSVLMALDHLRIVHQEMARVIGDLANGTMPAGTASTAAVKPSPEVTADVIVEYERSCDSLLATVAEANNLKTPLRFAHPWFGPLDAHSWHALAAGHLGIHRVQVERICAGLRTTR